MIRLSLIRSRALLALTATALMVASSATAAEAASIQPSDASQAKFLAAEGPHSASGTGWQTARFLRQLGRYGYVSQSGAEAVFDLNERYCSGAVFSGMWPNPQSPYIVTRLPEVPGQAPNTNPPVSWRLRQDEAVVLIGTTPPPEEYYSFDLTMVRGSLQTGPVLWTSIGDPINLKTVRTTGPTPFGRSFALVITGNRRTQAKVDKMLAASGLGAATNNMTIPPAMFRLGLDAGADQFLLGMRTSAPLPGFEQALERYRATPPLQVFRVRPGGSGNQTQPVYLPDPLPVPNLRVSGTGATELNLNPTLQLLRQRIIDAHPGYNATDGVVERGFEESYPGLQDKLVIDPPTTGVGALSNDADDPITPNFALPEGSFLVAYGTNHSATGQAAYSSVTVYADEKAAVALAAENNLNLYGSARDFIGDQKNADKFYAWTFSRAGDGGPTGAHVTMLPSTNSDFCAQYGGNRPVDLSTLRLVARAYMQPATLSRPALSSLLLDRVLVFTPK
ncbi:hypothetical protein KDK95_01705 [Actinospica sp. MGRD01-02]|uniref:Uncharacterized protein n=1 Tax=Actinospica acidithermotolerans TaxID=2828514 RepID=A0A941E6U0_9ACTN|nr:hypothetical protein [Actinospica acidithermotolerans]MBR7825003.1 hypothetical protein [Actinospica acidithermotolerans]